MQSKLPMHLSKQCGARTRSGKECLSPAMPNGRCRMHGGPSPGAPKGNKHALKHGRYTALQNSLREQLSRSSSAVVRAGPINRAGRRFESILPRSALEWAVANPGRRCADDPDGTMGLSGIAGEGSCRNDRPSSTHRPCLWQADRAGRRLASAMAGGMRLAAGGGIPSWCGTGGRSMRPMLQTALLFPKG
jgi:hypothetical protein